MNLFSPFWKERVQRNLGLTLHDRMMQEAEHFVQHFWTDVAKHDKIVLDSMLDNSVALWVVRTTGSYLCPLYTDIDQHHAENKDRFILAEHIVLRIRAQLVNQSEKFKECYRFYLVWKGCDPYDGTIVSISLADVFDLVFDKSGNFH